MRFLFFILIFALIFGVAPIYADTQTRNPITDEAVSGTWTGSVGTRFTVVDDYPDTAGTDELVHGTTTAGNLTFTAVPFVVPLDATSISVSVKYYDYKNGSQSASIAGRLKVSGSYFASAAHNPTNGAANRTQRTNTWATNPNTAAAWTPLEVNAIQAFGWVATDVNPSIALSSVQLEVTYTPASNFQEFLLRRIN